ncbi:MAG: mycothione reductase, partial [Microthrixaceae bacterium]
MYDFDLLIIGTGSGNSLLSEEFDSWNVAIVERSTFGGTCLNVGCIPSKMLVLPADRVQEALETSDRLNVQIAPIEVDWPSMRDRVFGRIDPIALGGTLYRQSQKNLTVFLGEAGFVGERTVQITLKDGSLKTVTAARI